MQYGVDEDGKNEEKTLLHIAAEEGKIDTVKSLLERGVDVDARNASNETPLERAAAKGEVDVVRLLIERGAEVDSRDDWGWTPLHESSRYGQLEVSRVLLDHGAKRERKDAGPLDLDAPLSGRWTPLSGEIVT